VAACRREDSLVTDAQPLDPTAAFAELGRIKLSDMSLDGVLDPVAVLVKRTIPGAAEVSVTLVRDRRAGTAAFTGHLAKALDEAQHERGHGPCLDASAAAAALSVPRTSDETRWPDWAQRALDAGVGSSLSIGLPLEEKVTGALNIYAVTPNAFDEDAIAVAQTFAGYAAIALATSHPYDTTATLAQHMQAAMESRAVIEQAKGIIMGHRRCTPDEAFQILTELSQDTNRKVRDVAEALVTRAVRTPKP
jgi:GAF domain-containing protein